MSASSKEDSEQSLYSQKAVSNSGENIASQNKQVSLTGQKERVSATRAAAPAPLDPIRKELAADLLKAGVAKKEADYLAALARLNGHGKDYVKQALSYIDRQRSVHSREGLLIHLVKTNWQPPVQVQEAPRSSDSTATQLRVPLPSASSIRPEHLPGLIEIEKRNLEEATSDFERETARIRLAHLQNVAAQLELNPQANTITPYTSI